VGGVTAVSIVFQDTAVSGPTTAHKTLRIVGHQNWIPFGRERLLRLFCDPGRAVDVPFDVDFFGARYTGTLANFIDWSVYFYGAYSSHELMLLRDVARGLRASGQSIHFCDVGANVGQHSLFMSMHADRVSSFEPFPRVCKKLRALLEHNCIDNVRVFPVALGDADGELDYFEPDESNLGTGSFAAAPGNFAGRVLRLPVRCGDRFVADNDLAPVAILKIDVEGFEASVLRGLKTLLKRDRPIILMELSDQSRRAFGDCTRFLDHLFDHPRIFDVGAKRCSPSYRLSSFHFDDTDELLVIPSELTDALAPRLGLS